MGLRTSASLLLVCAPALFCGVSGCGGSETPTDPSGTPRFGVHIVQPGDMLVVPGVALRVSEVQTWFGLKNVGFEILGANHSIGPHFEQSATYHTRENLHVQGPRSMIGYDGLVFDIISISGDVVEVEVRPHVSVAVAAASQSCKSVFLNVGDYVEVPGGVVLVQSVYRTGPHCYLWYRAEPEEANYQAFEHGAEVPAWFVPGVGFGSVEIGARSVRLRKFCLAD